MATLMTTLSGGAFQTTMSPVCLVSRLFGSRMASSMLLKSFPVGPFATNCVVMGHQETGKGIVIDPGGDPKAISQCVADLKLSIEGIFHTHGHVDHFLGVGGVPRVPDAKLWVHGLEKGWYSSSHEGTSRVLRLLASAALRIREEDLSVFDEGARIAVGAGAAELVNGGEAAIDEGVPSDIVGEVIHTPGHSPGSCAFYFPSQGLLVGGDTLFAGSIGRTDLPGGSLSQLVKSVREKLFVLPDDVRVITGHGPETTIGEEKRTNPFFA